jgi:hypothetical protein
MYDIIRVSTRYEGDNEFVGFNFPSSIIKKKDVALFPFKDKCDYVIGYMKGDKETIAHELLHAKYYMDRSYRSTVKKSWNNLRRSNPKKFKSILKQLKRDGYQEKVFVDEFQAYYPKLVKE